MGGKVAVAPAALLGVLAGFLGTLGGSLRAGRSPQPGGTGHGLP